MTTTKWAEQKNGSFFSRDSTPCSNDDCNVFCGWLRRRENLERWEQTGLCQSCQDNASFDYNWSGKNTTKE